MIAKSAILGALIGLALSALLLTGSLRVAVPAIHQTPNTELEQFHVQGLKIFRQGSYYAAHEVFIKASARAKELGLPHFAASNMVAAGVCLYLALNFRGAQKDFSDARQIAKAVGDLTELSAAENNLANLYLHMGEKEKALEVAREALAGPEGRVTIEAHGKLLFQQADALAELERLPDAEPSYLEAIAELSGKDDFDSVARIEGKLGAEYLKADRLGDAESILTRAFWVVRVHRLNASANILSSLAELKDRQGDVRSATHLFDAALEAPPNISPVWQIRSRRGKFRLGHGDLAGALADFREARRAALEMRADMVPTDQDRVALESESRLGAVIEGLVDAGNRLALETGDHAVLRETFDAAEQDRMWSLRALVPGANDWRLRLPQHYWELLAQYQTLERTAVAARSPEAVQRIVRLHGELQRIEADAADGQAGTAGVGSALEHTQEVLGEDSVLFSFLITKTSAWVWAVDRGKVDVYPLPNGSRIEAEAKAFTDAVRRGALDTPVAAELYHDLFGSVPARYLKHARWLIEPDYRLNGLPFAALAPKDGTLLVEQAAVEAVPGALLLERGTIAVDAPFLGVADPIYNRADPRYRRGAGKTDLTLPRLPNTADELTACARAWGSGGSKMLTGADATEARVREALRGHNAVVHFATHVVTAPGAFRSGLIALSLDESGSMGLLGPEEIVTRPVTASLIVMNGCHSAQGQALAGTGLMGLTRAWIGAGARSVIATQWDVPDLAAQTLMTDFYRALRQSPEGGPAFALREAQLRAIRSKNGGAPWAAYSLLSRMQ